MSAPPDVLIIGAGVAGLTAARDLTRRAHACSCSEARDRLGSRVMTHHTPDGPVELGAGFRARRRRGDPAGVAREARLAAARDGPRRAPREGGSGGDDRLLLGHGRGPRLRLSGRTRRILPAPRRPGGCRGRDQGGVPGARRGVSRGRSGPDQRPVAAQEHGRGRRRPGANHASSGSRAGTTAWLPPSFSASTAGCARCG